MQSSAFFDYLHRRRRLSARNAFIGIIQNIWPDFSQIFHRAPAIGGFAKGGAGVVGQEECFAADTEPVVYLDGLAVGLSMA